MALKHEGSTGQIIKAFYKVYNELGYGFLIEIGLLLNFGPKPEFRRKIFTNDKKRHRELIPTGSVQIRPIGVIRGLFLE